jgi:hypothetical protein
VSSIGSVPEPLPGIAMRELLYEWADADLGRLAGYDRVFSVGNVVTGKGNIVASRRHSAQVSAHVIERFLGIGNGRHEGEEALLGGETGAAAGAARVADELLRGRPLAPAEVDGVMARVRARQEAVGYVGSYRDWLERVTPPDLA